MLDARERGLRLLAEDPEIDRHLAPAEEEELALLEHLGGDRFRPGLGVGVVVGQEHHADGEVVFLEKLVAESRDLGREQLVGNLGHHAGAVAGLRVGVERAPMHERADGAQADLEDAIRPFAAYLGHETDAAGIVFVLGGIERASRGRKGLVHRRPVVGLKAVKCRRERQLPPEATSIPPRQELTPRMDDGNPGVDRAG